MLKEEKEKQQEKLTHRTINQIPLDKSMQLMLLPIAGAGTGGLLPGTYDLKCRSCIWACRIPVEMIIDHWNLSQKRYRFETFCYGPKSCSIYSSGPTRKVPGRRGLIWEEEDWIDEESIAHRYLDD